jgi:hypothetical protein
MTNCFECKKSQEYATFVTETPKATGISHGCDDASAVNCTISYVRHTLTVHGVYILENPMNGRTVMREVKTLWEKWG